MEIGERDEICTINGSIKDFFTGMGPITVKYLIPWSHMFWRHETSGDVIIFFAERPGQTLTLHSKTVLFC